jgi:hypothetical protein
MATESAALITAPVEGHPAETLARSLPLDASGRRTDVD